MSYGSRDVSQKLMRYAHLLEAELMRLKALDSIIEDESGRISALEAELEDARQMQNYLWELKERI
jgi:C4-dicarboxylate-specific signal transduction histidine kinase